jgi:hypothetical protein
LWLPAQTSLRLRRSAPVTTPSFVPE